MSSLTNRFQLSIPQQPCSTPLPSGFDGPGAASATLICVHCFRGPTLVDFDINQKVKIEPHFHVSTKIELFIDTPLNEQLY